MRRSPLLTVLSRTEVARGTRMARSTGRRDQSLEIVTRLSFSEIVRPKPVFGMRVIPPLSSVSSSSGRSAATTRTSEPS